MKPVAVLVLALHLAASLALCQTPQMIGYQGILTDSLGNPRPDGTYSMAFRLYDVETLGSPLWEEVKTLTVRDGLFATLLGDQVVFGPAVTFDRRYWLGVSVSGGPELSPRLSLASAPYSLHARTADSAMYLKTMPTPGGAAGGDLSGTYPNPSIAPGSVTGEKIANGTVTSDDIADMTRVLTFPARAMSYSPTSSVISTAYNGLQWTNTSTDAAYLILPRPADWDGLSDVTFTLWFQKHGTSTGQVNFFVRPRTSNSGDSFVDAAGILGTAVTVASGLFYKHLITVPASAFGTKELWQLVFQRNPDTFSDPVNVMSVSIAYTAVR